MKKEINKFLYFYRFLATKDSMAVREPGVISRENMHFRNANLFAKENLLYILWGSLYLVDKPYRVK